MVEAWLLVKAFLTSKVGLALIAIAAAIGALLLFGHMRYAAGVTDGKAQVQASIDAPLTGWSARLAQSEANYAKLKLTADGQTAELRAKSAADAATLASATKDLTAAQATTATYAAKIATLMKPLVGIDTCARVMDADQRLLGTLQ